MTTFRTPAPPRSSAGVVSAPTAALVVWLVVVGALTFIDQLVPVQARVQFMVVSLALTALGVILAALAAKPLPLRRSLVRLHLGPWVCVSFSVVFGLASLAWLIPVWFPGDEQRAAVDPAYLVPALLAAALGLASFCLGYRITPCSVSRTVSAVDAALRGASPARIGVRAILTLWGISILAQGFSMLTGSFGYLSSPQAALSATSSMPAVLAFLGDLGLLGSLLAGWRFAAARTTSSLLLLALVIVTQLGLGLFAGMKEEVIVPLFAAAFGYGSRRRVRLAPVVLAGAMVVIFVVPFITQYRVAVLTGSGRLTPSEVVEVVGFEDLLSSTRETSVMDSSEQLATRLTRVGDLAVVMQKTPSRVPYASPLELAAGPFLGLIPRSVWPEKPVLEAGFIMSTVYYGLPSDLYTSSAMTPYGDLWRHGGPWMLALGMALLGSFVRSVDDRPGDPATDPRLLFLPMLLFTPLVKQETDYLGFLASLATVVLTAALASRLVTATAADPAPSIRGRRRLIPERLRRT